MIHSLLSLDLRKNESKPRNIQVLTCLKDLTYLGLDQSVIVPERLNIICENFRKLEHLLLGDCGTLTDVGAVKLSLLRNLKTLNRLHCVGLTDSTFGDDFRFQALKSRSVLPALRLLNHPRSKDLGSASSLSILFLLLQSLFDRYRGTDPAIHERCRLNTLSLPRKLLESR